MDAADRAVACAHRARDRAWASARPPPSPAWWSPLVAPCSSSWCAGQLSRDEAVRYATRGMTALLETSGTGDVSLARAKAVR